MNTKEMIMEINARFNLVQQQFQLMLIGFEEEAIHDFRTGIKKLRAFFRLINTRVSKKRRVSLTKKIKIFYWYAGEIRNLQLHQKNISDALETTDDPPSRYFTSLKKQVESLQGAVMVLSPGDLQLGKINLPLKSGKAFAKKFMKLKVKEFNKLRSQPLTDDTIHCIRKILKDILYNWKYCRHYKNMLPAFISEKTKILQLTELIGNFYDKVTGIHLLETFLLMSEDGEKELPEQIIKKWKEQKSDLQVKICSALYYSPA